MSTNGNGDENGEPDPEPEPDPPFEFEAGDGVPNPLWQPPRSPTVIVTSLLRAYLDTDALDGTFEARWIHTGRPDDGNPNAQITVEPATDGTLSPTGWTGIDGAGRGPVARRDGTLDVNVWVPHDESPYPVTGENPKKLAWELRQGVETVIGHFATGTTYEGERELTHLGVGEVVSLGDPDWEGQRWLVPVLYSYHQGRVGSPPASSE